MLDNIKKDIINSLKLYISDDIDQSLQRNMVDPCSMRKTCKSRFTDFLGTNSNFIGPENLPEDFIDIKLKELDEIRQGAPYDKCEICFQEVNSLFEKQLKLIKSKQIYSESEEKVEEISSIPEELTVKTVLEPLSNKQRLQILKSLSFETKTFTELSEITGLRGGNLLFHLQKLLAGDLIIQRHERGDYMITKKGYNLLLLLAKLMNNYESE